MRENIPLEVTQASVIKHPAFALMLLFSMAFLVSVMTGPVSAATDSDHVELQQAHKDHLRTLGSLVGNPENPLVANNGSLDDQVVVVTFFASWCPPCLDEFKALNDIQQELGKDSVSIVAVNVFEQFDDNDEARMAKFLNTTQPQFTVLEGNEQSRKLFGDIRRIPTLIVFDKSGTESFRFTHARGASKQSVDSHEILQAIQPLL